MQQQKCDAHSTANHGHSIGAAKGKLTKQSELSPACVFHQCVQLLVVFLYLEQSQNVGVRGVGKARAECELRNQREWSRYTHRERWVSAHRSDATSAKRKLSGRDIVRECVCVCGETKRMNV